MVTHCKWLFDNGCNGILIFGTTGEGNSFSLSEKKEAIYYLAENGIPPNKLIVGTGLCAYTETVSLSNFCLDNDINNLLILPPFYYKDVSDAGIFYYFCQIIQKLKENDCNIYLYHFPAISQIGFSMELIERLIKMYPKTVIGMKDSSGDWQHMQQIINRFPDFELFPGTEIFLLDILKAGGPGCISATVNVTAVLAAEVYKNWQSKDMSEQMAEITKIRKEIAAFPMIAALKSLMANITGRQEWRTVRPPLVALDNDDSKELFNKISKFNLKL